MGRRTFRWVSRLLLLAMAAVTLRIILEDHPSESFSVVDQYLASSSSKAQQHRVNGAITTSTGIMHTNGEKDAIQNVSSSPYLEILRQVGIENDTLKELYLKNAPNWSEIEALYGSTPIIYGLETCEAFRKRPKRSLGVAGTFNSGTNLLAQLLSYNCAIRGSPIHWQVPWYVHTHHIRL
jgi:hypothetical protein